MAHLTQSSRRGLQSTCHIHIKALGNALFVCVRGHPLLSVLWVTLSWHCLQKSLCLCGFSLPGQIILQFELKLGMAEARISSGPGPLLSIKPSQCCKVSSCNEPCHRYHCTNIPTTQHAYWLEIASARTCVCVAVCTQCMCACSHKLTFSRKKRGNRLTLWLIRKLMHRKSRQRHCSPSARSAGENNLHIARLMDTFIGSADTEKEGLRGRGRE